jgi:hypothetical protein
MSLRKAPAKALPINEELLQLLQAIDNAHASWRSTVKHIDAACDEVWLARMWEVENLESHYRDCQDQLFFYLKQAIHL